MKKFISIILVMVFVFCFAACGVKEDDPAQNSSVENKSNDIKTAVLKGEIPELQLSLGDSVEDLENYYDQLETQIEESHEDGEGHVHNDNDIYMNISRGTLSVTYEIGTEKYYYEKEKRDEGISVICSLDAAFGFNNGTSRTDVEARLADLNTKSLQAGDDELYFVPLADALILRYTEGDYQLDFYFNNNQLVATVLRNTKNWTI